MKGTIRWMAPELLLPENFGFTGKLRKQLPSQSTDIYAIGMTVLEVSAHLPAGASGPHLSRLLRDALHSAMSTTLALSCARSSKEIGLVGHSLGSLTPCGNCWLQRGLWRMARNPGDGHLRLPCSTDLRARLIIGTRQSSRCSQNGGKKTVSLDRPE